MPAGSIRWIGVRLTAGLLVGALMVSLDAITAQPSWASAKLECEPCRVTVFEREESWSFEHAIAVDPRDPDHLVVAEMEFYADPHGGIRTTMVVRVSRDGGRTWTAGDFPDGYELDPTHAFFGSRDFIDPFAAILRDGTVLVGGLAASYAWPGLTGPDVFVARSFDGGMTFPEVNIVAEGAGVFPAARVNDYPKIAVGEDGTILVAWAAIDWLPPVRVPPDQDPGNPERNVAPFDLRFSFSRDGGATWTPPAPVITGGFFDYYYPPSVAVTGDGSFMIAPVKRREHSSSPANDPIGWAQWANAPFNNGSLALITSRDRGKTWAVREFPKIVARPGSTRLAIATVGGEELLYLGYLKPTGRSAGVPMLGLSRDLGKTWMINRLGSISRPPHPTTSYAVDGRGIAYFAHVQEKGRSEQVVVTAASDKGPMGQLTLEKMPSFDSAGHYWGVVGLERGAYVLWNTPSGPDGPVSWNFNPSGEDFDLKGARVWSPTGSSS